MSRPMTVDVVRYMSWRAWLRVRYRTRCQVCGERTSGHRTWEAGIHEAQRHLAWHRMVGRIIDQWLARMHSGD
jgi:transposase